MISLVSAAISWASRAVIMKGTSFVRIVQATCRNTRIRWTTCMMTPAAAVHTVMRLTPDPGGRHDRPRLGAAGRVLRPTDRDRRADDPPCQKRRRLRRRGEPD